MKKYLETKAESLENKITQIFGETVAKEGNKFSAALMAARENGKKFFSVNGKQFKTEDYKEGFVNKQPPRIFWNEIKEYEKYFTLDTKIVPAKSRNHAGIIGAALSAKDLID